MNTCAYHFHTVIIGGGLISLAHNINLVVSMSECLLTTLQHTHSPPQMVHEASEHQLGCEGRAQPIPLPSHTQAEILLVRCGGDKQSRNSNEYCSHLLSL